MQRVLNVGGVEVPMVWMWISMAAAGQTAQVTCADGEPVRPPKKASVCTKPFTLWARDIEGSVSANLATMQVGADARSRAVELSSEVAKALRTQASALCVGMMTAPCTVKDDYLRVVREMPDLLVELEQARSDRALLDALQRAKDVAEPDAEAPESASTDPVAPCDRVDVVLDDAGKHLQGIRGGTWRISVQASGGGVDGTGVMLRWDTMSCRTSTGEALTEGMAPATRDHELDCRVPSSGDTLWVVNPQGGLLDGPAGRAEVSIAVCPG